MSDKQFIDMDDKEFDSIINGYIERMAKGYGEMPAEIYFNLLAEQLGDQAEETLTLSIDVVDDDLVIHPDREISDILISGNEIVIGKHRLVLQLAS